jgi:hypothetical protein
MFSKVRSLGIQGIGGYEVSVEIFLSGACRSSTWSVCPTPP